ncbi:MAG: quinone-dependent dihydroorotate dehydrogenase [Bdellovibrionota bacterium]
MPQTKNFKSRLSFWLGDKGSALLRLLPPELSHDIAIWALKNDLINILPQPEKKEIFQSLNTKVSGIGELHHPIGLAAGFDKNCLCPNGLARLGFSFLEIGTITPLAQSGNKKPRLFRQSQQRALINRMGFNNDGSLEIASRLQSLNWDDSRPPLGINLGKNKITALDQAIEDYLEGYNTLSNLGRYYVINISSPNTAGLRQLASNEFIHQLGTALSGKKANIWIKLDPDMPKKQFQSVVETVTDHSFSGLILSNTHRVEWPEVGGQSGHPIAIMSTRCLEWAWEVHKGQIAMIGSGGILSGLDIYEKIIRGASAVQIYAALIFRGPWVVYKLLEELAAEMSIRGIHSIEDAFASYYN